MGSSPRLRGAPYGVQLRDERGGIIPALAGSTFDLCATFRGFGDHPRACGEHREYDGEHVSHVGSSPRLRGARELRSRVVVAAGIIPALAGSTQGPHVRRVPREDHPRACGEHESMLDMMDGCAGSSPRLRGAHDRAGSQERRLGIIPALAGSTGATSNAMSHRRDHPRACGEHRCPRAHCGHVPGSSPRLRGARKGRTYDEYHARIIPALAGSTKACWT